MELGVYLGPGGQLVELMTHRQAKDQDLFVLEHESHTLSLILNDNDYCCATVSGDVWEFRDYLLLGWEYLGAL